ncbi:MAG: hypothetical protein L0Y35_03250 [Flammeovirgaceae bacterium]|nr:hypothetical protein [Flammeovirgaceae bacterium]
MKNYRSWLITSVVFQLLTAGVHSIALFVTPLPQNDTEKQLFDLMQNYRSDMGAGFSPSTFELMTALSSCFTLVYLMGGLTTWFLLRKKVAVDILKGVIGIQVLILGTCFFIMLFLTFLPPVVLTGIVFFCLSASYFLLAKRSS